MRKCAINKERMSEFRPINGYDKKRSKRNGFRSYF